MTDIFEYLILIAIAFFSFNLITGNSFEKCLIFFIILLIIYEIKRWIDIIFIYLEKKYIRKEKLKIN